MPTKPQTHQAVRNQDKRRKNSYQRGYTRDWSEYSRLFRQMNPLCVECAKKNITRASEVTDHIVPHKGNQELFWDSGNHRALCKECHDRATVEYDGGFGRQIKPKPR